MITFPLIVGDKRPAIGSWSTLETSVDIPEGHNVGILCGEKSGVVVLDYDSDKWPDYMPETLTVKTPRGFHFYFRHPGFFVKNSVSKLKEKLDVRGDGGYVVGPGSVVGGIQYSIIRDLPIAEVPEWAKTHPDFTVVKAQGKPAPIVPSECRDENDLIAFLLERWPPTGTRNEAHLALAGTLLAHGCAVDVACRILGTITDVTKEPGSKATAEDRHKTVYYTAQKLTEGYRVTQSGELDRLLGDGTSAQLAKHFAPDFSRFFKKDAPEANPSERAKKFISGELEHAGDLDSLSLSQLTHVLKTHEDWEGCFRRNLLDESIKAFKPVIDLTAEETSLSDRDVDRVCEVFCHYGYNVSFDLMYRAVNLVADTNAYNPIVDYLEECRAKPATGAIRRLTLDVLGGNPEDEKLVRKWLIAAVRRAYRPGTKFDNVLVLRGATNAGKSIFGKILFGEWFSDQMPANLADKDASKALAGKWCIEFAELASLLSQKSTREVVKAFITRTEEHYRPPYGRSMVTEKRRCVFLGTTNEDEFLDDPTGNRRYWIISVKDEIDIQLLESIRNEIWSEAWHLAQTNEQHYLTREEESSLNESREIYSIVDPWTRYIEDYCKGRAEIIGAEDIYRERIAYDSNQAIEKLDYKLRKRINDVLKRLGCKRGFRNARNVWIVPEKLAGQKPVGKYAKANDARVN